MVLDMWGVPHLILNLTFSPTENAQYFTLFKLDTRRFEKPILSCYNILHPHPPQPKSFTCFYADYISFLEETIRVYISVCVCVCVCVSVCARARACVRASHCILSQQRRVPLKATEETGLKLNMDIAKHILHELHTNKISINRMKMFPDLCM